MKKYTHQFIQNEEITKENEERKEGEKQPLVDLFPDDYYEY